MTPLFVYGTLRPGCRLNGWLKDLPSVPAQAIGGLYHLTDHPDPMYPVADFDEQAVIYGDLFRVPDDIFKRLSLMEINAGYQVRQIAVTVDGHARERAVAFHWPHARRGFPIPGGDWSKWTGVAV